MKIENMWPDFNDDFEFNTPKEILEQQANFLQKITGDIIYADVVELEFEDKMNDNHWDDNSFGYAFELKSKFLDNYKFRLFRIYHDITIYPVEVRLDLETRKELGYSDRVIKISNEEKFNNLLKKVFKTDRVSIVVHSLMKLSK